MPDPRPPETPGDDQLDDGALVRRVAGGDEAAFMTLYDRHATLLFGASLLLQALDRRGLARGRLLAILALLYGTARFLLDFLRASDVPYPDPRYLGLTPAQYFCFALWAYGIWRLRIAARDVSG